MTITAEQKAEWAEAREQATAAIARLNDLYAATGRQYRARWGHYKLDLFPDPADLDDIADQDAADLGPIEGYAPNYRPGTERAEREDDEI